VRHELILTGGLGNQLFVVLEALRRSLTSGHPVTLNVTEYKATLRADRPFVVGQLLPDLEQAVDLATGLPAHYRYWASRIMRRLDVVNVEPLGLPGDAVLSCTTFPGWKTHLAYFQYFNGSPLDHRALELLKDLFLREPLQMQPEHLALHLRRGDYLLPQHSIHGTVPLTASLNEASRAIVESGFRAVTVFTDSPEQLDLADLNQLAVPFSIDEGGDPVSVFRRMAAHSGIVASNSSFSLWAALLGTPRYFSMPSTWMKGVNSDVLGFPDKRRYPCTLS